MYLLRFLNLQGEPTWRLQQVLDGVYKVRDGGGAKLCSNRAATVLTRHVLQTGCIHSFWGEARRTKPNGITSMVCPNHCDGG